MTSSSLVSEEERSERSEEDMLLWKEANISVTEAPNFWFRKREIRSSNYTNFKRARYLRLGQ